MSEQASVSFWLGQLKQGHPDAPRELWDRYFARLVSLARQRLKRGKPLGSDEEDVALSAFHSFCRGVEKGRFTELEDRDNLWRLLVTITVHKSLRVMRAANTKKRGGDARVLGNNECDGDVWSALADVADEELTPEFAVEIAEECERLLAALKKPDLQAVAVRKMEGYTNEEIATHLSCAPRTVERKLQIIRGIWEKTAEIATHSQ
jgi:DNA-directed RNA polymerase specialized sigma24 family protein